MNKPDVILLPTFAQVESWCKRAADDCPSGLFGCTAATFAQWIADLWERYGDGRLLVDRVQRSIMAQSAAEQYFAQKESSAPRGVSGLVERLARDALGVPTFDRLLEDAAFASDAVPLSQAEWDVLGALRVHRMLAQSHGFIEPGDALTVLASRISERTENPIAVEVSQILPLTWQQQAFFESCAGVRLVGVRKREPEQIVAAPTAVQVSLAYPSGKYAEVALVADEIRASASLGKIVVVCKNPLDVFDRLNRAMSGQGIRIAVDARKPFCQTDFGRAYWSMLRCLYDPMPIASALADVASSPFSGFPLHDAYDIDTQVRNNRTLDREGCLAPLRVASEPFSWLEELAKDPEADVLLGAFEQMVDSMPGRGELWKNEQRAALSALRSVTSAARMVQLDIVSCVSQIERLLVHSAAVSGRDYEQVSLDDAAVLVTTWDKASTMPPGECAALILTELTTDDYPVADTDDAFSLMMEKIGIEPYDNALDRMRRSFNALSALPTSRLVLMRPINDETPEPTHPCVALEEFLDVCQADGRDAQVVVCGDTKQRGEELLFANEVAAPSDSSQPMRTAAPGALCSADGLNACVALPRRLGGGRVLPSFAPSPSQVEVYLECPQKWFVQRRLAVEDIGEQFGPLEKGTFAHAALQTFYQEFQQSGERKVNAVNLDGARSLMRDVTRRLAQAQYDLKPGSGRLVAVTQLEERELAAFAKQLEDYLEFEAQLLPTYHPAYFEYSIDAEHAQEYAGHLLVGVVDRIDIDDFGHAVIIDYKAGLNPEYEIAGKDMDHAGKVQTRMYAQAVKRLLGLDVVGALYVSYGRTHALTGAYDPLVLDAQDLPSMRHERCQCAGHTATQGDGQPALFADASFADMLDMTESAVARAIERMKVGDVDPNPSCASACDYCPVANCPKRGA